MVIITDALKIHLLLNRKFWNFQYSLKLEEKMGCSLIMSYISRYIHIRYCLKHVILSIKSLSLLNLKPFYGIPLPLICVYAINIFSNKYGICLKHIILPRTFVATNCLVFPGLKPCLRAPVFDCNV